MRILTGMCLFVLLATSPAMADPLLPPPAPLHRFVSGQLLLFQSAKALDFDDFGKNSIEDEFGTDGAVGVTFSVFGEPVPYVFAQGAGSAPHKSGRTLGSLIYEFEVVGPAGPTDPVPVRVDAFGHVLATASEEGTATALARWSLTDATLGFAPVFQEELLADPLTIEDELDHAIFLNMAANHVFRVTLFADIFFNTGKFGARAEALMDPVFSFVGDVGPDYSFRLAEGIGNGGPTAVPEPGSALLLSIGATAIGLVLRRSRRRHSQRPGVPE